MRQSVETVNDRPPRRPSGEGRRPSSLSQKQLSSRATNRSRSAARRITTSHEHGGTKPNPHDQVVNKPALAKSQWGRQGVETRAGRERSRRYLRGAVKSKSTKRFSDGMEREGEEEVSPEADDDVDSVASDSAIIYKKQRSAPAVPATMRRSGKKPAIGACRGGQQQQRRRSDCGGQLREPTAPQHWEQWAVVNKIDENSGGCCNKGVCNEVKHEKSATNVANNKIDENRSGASSNLNDEKGATIEINALGYCFYHPSVRLCKKKWKGGWKMLQDSCPHCVVNEREKKIAHFVQEINAAKMAEEVEEDTELEPLSKKPPRSMSFSEVSTESARGLDPPDSSDMAYQGSSTRRPVRTTGFDDTQDPDPPTASTCSSASSRVSDYSPRGVDEQLGTPPQDDKPLPVGVESLLKQVGALPLSSSKSQQNNQDAHDPLTQQDGKDPLESLLLEVRLGKDPLDSLLKEVQDAKDPLESLLKEVRAPHEPQPTPCQTNRANPDQVGAVQEHMEEGHPSAPLPMPRMPLSRSKSLPSSSLHVASDLDGNPLSEEVENLMKQIGTLHIHVQHQQQAQMTPLQEIHSLSLDQKDQDLKESLGPGVSESSKEEGNGSSYSPSLDQKDQDLKESIGPDVSEINKDEGNGDDDDDDDHSLPSSFMMGENNRTTFKETKHVISTPKTEEGNADCRKEASCDQLTPEPHFFGGTIEDASALEELIFKPKREEDIATSFEGSNTFNGDLHHFDPDFKVFGTAQEDGIAGNMDSEKSAATTEEGCHTDAIPQQQVHQPQIGLLPPPRDQPRWLKRNAGSLYSEKPAATTEEECHTDAVPRQPVHQPQIGLLPPPRDQPRRSKRNKHHDPDDSRPQLRLTKNDKNGDDNKMVKIIQPCVSDVKNGSTFSYKKGCEVKATPEFDMMDTVDNGNYEAAVSSQPDDYHFVLPKSNSIIKRVMPKYFSHRSLNGFSRLD